MKKNMKLSEAIFVGDVLKTCDSHTWLTEDENGNVRGCAIGGALLAVGITYKKYKAARTFYNPFSGQQYAPETMPVTCQYGGVPYVGKFWPWVTFMHLAAISNMYMQVERKEITLEKLVDYVRSVEPADEVKKPKAKTGIVKRLKKALKPVAA